MLGYSKTFYSPCPVLLCLCVIYDWQLNVFIKDVDVHFFCIHTLWSHICNICRLFVEFFKKKDNKCFYLSLPFVGIISENFFSIMNRNFYLSQISGKIFLLSAQPFSCLESGEDTYWYSSGCVGTGENLCKDLAYDLAICRCFINTTF